jgi:NADH-quinone oxidoreductase subunit C
VPSPQTPVPGGNALDPPSLRPPIDDAQIERLDRDQLRARLDALRAEGVMMLLDIGGVDYPERTPRFDVVNHLLALPTVPATPAEIGKPRRIRLLVGVPGDDPTLPSVVDLWPNADWAEREIFDLFGLTFTGHPDLRRIQMPDDWIGHPLRKDYPLRGPARERSPRPPFALKNNVPAGTPPSGKVAAALMRQVKRAREEDAQ